MGFIGDVLGLGTDNDSGFHAQKADILQGVNTGQVNTASNNALRGINQQQAFLDALNQQNGLQNQRSVFDQQQALANQLQGVANGTGPNPAQAMLANQTGQNAAEQAAMMAGQRGSSANVGLLARQIGQQGANIQQQSVGQGAALQANQSLNAMGALQQQQGMMGNLANQQVNQQQQGLSSYNGASQNYQQNLLNALAQYNQSNVGMQSNINASNAGIASVNAQGQQGLLGGVLGGAGAALGLKFAGGGEVPKHFDDGGMVNPTATDSGPQSYVTKFFNGFNAATNGGNHSAESQGLNPFGGMQANSSAAGALQRGLQGFGQGIGNVIRNRNQESPGVETPPEPGGGGAMTQSLAPMLSMLALNQGAVVPGKAVESGNSLKNDKVPALLSPKEIVLPRSVTMAKDAPERAKRFVEAVLAKHRGGL